MARKRKTARKVGTKFQAVDGMIAVSRGGRTYLAFPTRKAAKSYAGIFTDEARSKASKRAKRQARTAKGRFKRAR